MNDDLTPEMWYELERVANGSDTSLDLRYEQGPFLDWLDALVSLGLVNFEQGDPGYFVYYNITPAGIARLEARRKNIPPQA